MSSLVKTLVTLSALIIPATANVVTIPLGNGDATTTGQGQVVGSSGSLTSYVIEDVPGTIVAGASTHYQTHTYPGGDFMSQGCSVDASSFVECEVYMSDADSGSTMVSTVPASLLSDVGIYVVSVTGTNTGVHPETTVKTVSNSAIPASNTAEPTGADKATERPSEVVAGHSATLTSESVEKATSSGAAANLVRDRSWIGGAMALVLAGF